MKTSVLLVSPETLSPTTLQHPLPATEVSSREKTPRERVRSLLIEYRQTRDEGVRDEIVSLNVKLVRYIAAKFISRGEPMEDLNQVGSIGLLKAIERFDPERGVDFATFAAPTIVGEIRRYFRDLAWAVRVPRGLQQLNVSVMKTIDEISAVQGRPPTLSQVAASLGVTEEQVIEAQEIKQVYNLQSIDAVEGPDSNIPRSLCLGGRDASMQRVEDEMALTSLFQCLTRREQIVIFLAFYKDYPQREIAKVLRVSQVQVSRLQTRALSKMKKASESAI